MKIKNQESKVTWQGIFVVFAIFLVSTAIDLAILIYAINQGMDFSTFLAWIWDEFKAADLESKMVFIILIIMPFLSAWIVYAQILKHYQDVNSYTGPDEIKFVDFQAAGIEFTCASPSYDKKIPYAHITNLSLTIETELARSKHGTYPVITCLQINIADNESNTYSVQHTPVKIDNIYKLVYYGQLVKKFNYRYIGPGKTEMKKRLDKRIENYVNNNYKKTIGMYFESSRTGILFVVLFSIVLLNLYFIVPPIVSDKDKEYVSYIENGYEYYRNHDTDRAYKEYQKALNIHNDDNVLHYYIALNYYRSKNYHRAVQSAQEGISNLNHKSQYHNAKNYKFISDEIGLYTTLGDSYRKLEDYKNAKKAYDYAMQHSNYKYSDTCFWRGICEYYLGEKDSALQDFENYKKIILKYFEDQTKTEYKDVYPRYDDNDLKNVDKWIKATQEL